MLALAGRRPAALAHEALSVAFVVAITVDSSRESSTGDAVLALRDASGPSHRFRRTTSLSTGGGGGGEGSAASPPVRRPAYERLIPMVMRAA